jgi:prophage regulatory protein
MAERKMRRLKPALERTGDTRSPFYKNIALGLMTRGVKISKRAVAWPDDELDAIIAARIAGWPDEAIRGLVARLHAKRKEAI